MNKKVDFLCWPGGGYNELSIRLSIEAGYKASTISSREKSNLLDNSGPYKRIQRYGMSSFISVGKSKYMIKNTNYLVQSLKGKMGNPVYRNLNRTRKLFYIIKDRI